jgi:Phosphotransferase enzyme family
LPPTPPDTGALAAAAIAEVTARLGLREVSMLRCSGKTLMAAADLAGRPVVVKVLLDRGGFWQARWQHEITIYRAFADEPPPVRVPALIRADGQRFLVLERLDGCPLDTARYPWHSLDAAQTGPCLAALSTLSAWRPPAGLFTPIWDYPGRVARYHAAGYLTHSDADALHRLLTRCGQLAVFGHGDPLPSNLLLTPDGGCALVDWEFGGMFLPGIDLAMLYTLLGVGTPEVRTSIDQVVAGTGIAEPFAVNLAMVLTREQRIHRELPVSPERDRHLAFLDGAWTQARDRIHSAVRNWTA